MCVTSSPPITELHDETSAGLHENLPPRRSEETDVSPHGRMVPSCSAPLVTRLRRWLDALRSRVFWRHCWTGLESVGKVLVLRGEPGIGKSRLLTVADETARERGMSVLTATGVQSEAHLPFAGLHQLLRPVRERVAELLPIQREALDAAFGLDARGGPRALPDRTGFCSTSSRRLPVKLRSCSHAPVGGPSRSSGSRLGLS